MPLHDFKCQDCGFKKEHFTTGDSKLSCPKCESKNYAKLVSSFTMNVEYGNVRDIAENKIDPHVKSVHEKIGREALDQDTKTLDNLYGSEKVKDTFHGSDS